VSFKSEAPEPTIYWTSTYIHMKCPHCQVLNVVNLGNLEDVTGIDIEACQCHGCSKKFWLPGNKREHETNSGLDWDPELTTFMEEEMAAMGLKPGDDLIETAECEKGRPSE
jgi:phage FluMu protein Com